MKSIKITICSVVRKEDSMTDNECFENIVTQIIEMYDEDNVDLEDKVTELEKEMEKTGYGKAFFFVTKGDGFKVDFVKNHIRYKYYAEYYDGFQAPFIVCAWNGSIDFLIELARKNGIILNT